MIKHRDLTGEGRDIETHYWHRLDDGQVQWEVCLWACPRCEGPRGFCFVQANQGDQAVLTTYGHMDAANIDFQGFTSPCFINSLNRW